MKGRDFRLEEKSEQRNKTCMDLVNAENHMKLEKEIPKSVYASSEVISREKG